MHRSCPPNSLRSCISLIPHAWQGTSTLKAYVDYIKSKQPAVKTIALICKENLKGFYAGLSLAHPPAHLASAHEVHSPGPETKAGPQRTCSSLTLQHLRRVRV